MEKVLLEDYELKKVQNIEISALKVIDEICEKYDIPYTLGYGSLIGAVRHNGFIPWDDDIDICLKRSDYEKLKEICIKELPEGFFYQCQETDPEYYHLFNKIRVDGTLFKESFQAHCNIHQGVYIDIFPIDNIPDGQLKRNFQFYKFHFYRIGLMAKFGNLSSRTGAKKIAAIILRMIYFPFSIQHLYTKATKTARKYESVDTKQVHSFYSPYKKRDVFDVNVFCDYEDVKFEDNKFKIVSDFNTVLTSLYGDYMKLPPEEKRVTRHSLVDFKV